VNLLVDAFGPNDLGLIGGDWESALAI